MDTKEGYTVYLAQLRQDLDRLERFPLSSRVQALVLAVGGAVVVAGFMGFAVAPLYLVLPFVVIPWWNLTRREMRYQGEVRRTSELIHNVERRLERATAVDEEQGEENRSY